MPQHYLAACAMFRDEAPFLAEWVAFHRAQGIEHFYLYDHGSQDDPAGPLRPFIERSEVTLQRWDIAEKGEAQSAAYNECLARHGGTARWIAFIDLDEFLFSPEGPLPQALEEFEGSPGVFVFWRCYGSSGHNERPRGLVTDSYLYRGKDRWARNRQGKSIVDPRWAVRARGPHHFVYRDSLGPVTERKQPILLRRNSRFARFAARRLMRLWPYFPGDAYSYNKVSGVTPSVDKLRINHYLIKSRADYEGKMDKNNATKKHKRKYTMEYFRYHDRNEVLDPVLRGRVKF